MFTIVTHHAPDLDAITSTWLLKRFLPNWQDAQIAFVAAGKTLNNEPVDTDPHVWHVDTGLGLLDHHQTGDYTCASKKVYEFLCREISHDRSWHDEALERLTEQVTFIDHFMEVNLPDANSDYHVFHAAQIIDGLKMTFIDDNHKVMDVGFMMLDAIYRELQEKVWAEEIIDTQGIQFESVWGKGIAFETLNDTVLEIAQKMGYFVVIRKDPKKKYVRIKGRPGTQVDFTKAYEAFLQKDPQATWFLHSSKKILLNGTTKNPDMKPTSLNMSEIIDILKK